MLIPGVRGRSRDLADLHRAPILSRLVPEETLYMYLAIMDHAVSGVLLRLDQGIQKPIFYINKTLVEA